MTHTITIRDSADVAPAEPGDTILDAMLMAGVGFAYSCQAGNCGTCKCELIEGDVFELEYSEHALTPEARAKGIVLACRTQVWSDVTIRRLSDEEFVVHPQRVMTTKVVGLEALTHDVWRLRLTIESGGPFTFSAGQYAALEFPFAPGMARDYSMANGPDEGVLEFHIRQVNASSVSAHIGSRLHLGDHVRVSGPLGTSYLRANHKGPVVAIAGGTGLAPIRSIVTTLAKSRGSQAVHLYFGLRSEADVYFESELHALETEFGVRVHIVLSDAVGPTASNDKARRHGLVTDIVAADFDDLTGFVAYLAGPPAMVEAAVPMLEAKGIATRDIHGDAFYPAPQNAPGRAAA